MASYWKFLYKQKKQNQSQLDTLSRRLSFKLPVVLRYNVCLAFAFGVVHAVAVQNPKWIIRYFYLTPLWFGFICYDDIIKYLQIKNIVKKPNIQKQSHIQQQPSYPQPITKIKLQKKNSEQIEIQKKTSEKITKIIL